MSGRCAEAVFGQIPETRPPSGASGRLLEPPGELWKAPGQASSRGAPWLSRHFFGAVPPRAPPAASWNPLEGSGSGLGRPPPGVLHFYRLQRLSNEPDQPPPFLQSGLELSGGACRGLGRRLPGGLKGVLGASRQLAMSGTHSLRSGRVFPDSSKILQSCYASFGPIWPCRGNVSATVFQNPGFPAPSPSRLCLEAFGQGFSR